MAPTGISVSANHDSGSIECVSAIDARALLLRLKTDRNSDFRQWFYFHIDGVEDQDFAVHIVNANRVVTEWAWKGYSVFASYDDDEWFRIPCTYERPNLTIEHHSEHNRISLAYFVPFSSRQHRLLIDACKRQGVHHEVLTTTSDGNPLDLLRFGERKPGKTVCWLIGRQHPGETMAQFWMRGLISGLTRHHLARGANLLDEMTVYVVPNMNPDGSQRGHHRTNSLGVDLNRQWRQPDATRSAEVFWVREKMHETGVDFCIDCHGDEVIPYVFAQGTTGVVDYGPDMQGPADAFRKRLLEVNRFFQERYGYSAVAKGKANLELCANYVAHTFGCAAMTLELPFKVAIDRRGRRDSWGERECIQLGADCAAALDAIL